MTTTLLFLVFGFTLLILGANWLVNGASSLARKLNISELIIGLTIVAFGTSAPELVVNIISSIKGFNDVTMGNVLGSNLFNLMLILGASGIVYPLFVQIKTIWKEIPFSLFAALILLVLANFSFNNGNIMSINRIDGILLLVFFVLFMIYIFYNLKNKTEDIETDGKIHKTTISIFLIVIGLAALVFSSRLVVENAIKLAQIFGLSEKVIGVTIVSAGTSLPELVTSMVAAFRKKSDIAIGNIIGSNIFNILLVLGVSSVINPIKFNSSFNYDIWLLIASTALLFGFMFSGIKYKLDRWEAGLLFTGYIGYIVYLLR